MFAVPVALIIVICLLAALVVALAYLDDQVVRVARQLVGRSRVVDRVMRLVSWTPLPVVVLFVVPMGWWLMHGVYDAAFRAALVCTLALGTTFATKHTLLRARPYGVLTLLGRRDSSFPSAHTAGSFAAAFALALMQPSLALSALAFAALVAFSRLYLGVHYLSDIVGGILIAYGFTLLVIHTDIVTFLASFLPFV